MAHDAHAPRPSAPRFARLPRLNATGLLFLLGLGVVWETVVRTGVVRYRYLPAPSEIVTAGEQLVSSGQLPRDLLHTLTSALGGWAIGSAAGIALGVTLGLSRMVWRYAMATVELLRACPAIAFVPVAVLLLGFSLEMELVITAYASMWPVLINTVEGVRGVSQEQRDVARTLRLSRMDRVSKVVLPAAAANVIVGLRLGLALSLALAVVAEMVGNPAGIGYQLVLLQQALQPASMFAYIITIGILGIALNSGFIAATRRLFPGVTAALREDSR